jgi:hypothetical protein
MLNVLPMSMKWKLMIPAIKSSKLPLKTKQNQFR